MKKIYTFIFILLLSASCGQSFNSNSGDEGQYAPISGIDDSTPEGARFLAAYKAYKNNSCFACHSWADYKSSEQWLNNNLVVSGNLAQSKVYTTLRNVGGTMPPSPLPQMSAAEISSIEAWINGL
jgi:hypothetical protein